MNTKKYLPVLGLGAAAALVLGLTGCASGSGGDANTLTITGNSSEKAGLDAVIAAFEEANEGVTVNVTYDKDPATVIRTQLSAGTAADVLYLFSGQSPASPVSLAPDGYLLDLSDQPWASAQPDPQRAINDVDGKQYIASVLVNGIGGIYNQSALDELGLEIPKTLPELFALCDAAAAQGKTAFALGLADAWSGQMVPYNLVSTLGYGENPDLDEQLLAGETTFAENGWVDAIDLNVEMNERGCFNGSPLGTSYDQALSLVGSGDALAYVMVNSAINAIQEQTPDSTLVFEPLPATDSADDTFMPVAYGGTYGINSKAKNPELAKEFLTFLTSNESAIAYAQEVGAVPYLLDGAEVPTTGANVESITNYQNEGRTSVFPNVLWPNAKVQDAFVTGLQEVFTGSLTSEQLVDNMQAAFDEGPSN